MTRRRGLCRFRWDVSHPVAELCSQERIYWEGAEGNFSAHPEPSSALPTPTRLGRSQPWGWSPSQRGRVGVGVVYELRDPEASRGLQVGRQRPGLSARAAALSPPPRWDTAGSSDEAATLERPGLPSPGPCGWPPAHCPHKSPCSTSAPTEHRPLYKKGSGRKSPQEDVKEKPRPGGCVSSRPAQAPLESRAKTPDLQGQACGHRHWTPAIGRGSPCFGLPGRPLQTLRSQPALVGGLVTECNLSALSTRVPWPEGQARQDAPLRPEGVPPPPRALLQLRPRGAWAGDEVMQAAPCTAPRALPPGSATSWAELPALSPCPTEPSTCGPRALNH